MALTQEEHTHAHAHAHPHAHEQYAARAHPEFVVLDIGAGVGALIIESDPELHGVEVEISAEGHDEERSHKEFLERSMGGTPAFTAVFDGLPAGRYTLWVKDEPWARCVEITGAEIAELDWRGRAGWLH